MSRVMDFIFQPDVQEIFDHFHSLWGIRIAFFSPSGEMLRAGRDAPNCRFCQILRRNLGLESTCLDMDRKMQKRACEEGGLVSYRCHAGLREAVMPIHGNGCLLGYIMIGQFHTGEPMLACLEEEWRRRIGGMELEEAFKEVAVVHPDQLEHILSLFSVLVKYIGSQEMIRTNSQSALEPVLLYLEQNISRNVTLQEAAELVHRSPSTLSHLFRKTLEKSFKQLQIDMKMDAAEQLFRDVPGITVREVSYRLGYHDPLYFSRLFKKYRSVSPRGYVRKMRQVVG